MLILLVEDHPTYQQVVVEILQATTTSRVIVAESLAQTDELLHDNPDVILLDLTLKDSTPNKTIEWVSRHSNEYPIIIITGYDDLYLLAALEAGACRYMAKIDIKPHSIRKIIAEAMTIHKRNRQIYMLTRGVGGDAHPTH